jgi:hypothetical protein
VSAFVDSVDVALVEQLWTAPEHLRSDDSCGSKAGDIYSFAIICSEIITRKIAWDINERNESVEGKCSITC